MSGNRFRERPGPSVAVAFTALLLLVIHVVPTAGQTEPRTCARCTGDARGAWTLAEITVNNLLVDAYHMWVLDEDRYGFNPSTTFGWDRSEFFINELGHPYHGGLYYASARAHAYDYWASFGFTVVGSLMWEALMDPEVASYNDLYSTSVGGAAFGEATYRLSEAVLRLQPLGGGFPTDVIAFILNPIVGLHEILDGPALQVSDGPVQLASHLAAGGRATSDGSSTTNVYELAFTYGDYFTGERLEPFEAFELTSRVNLPSSRPLADFHIVGVLAGGPLGHGGGTWQHVAGLFQHLDYQHPQGTQYGGQSFAGGLRSRRGLTDGLDLRLGADLLLTPVSAVSSEVVITGGARDYDHGTGGGVKLAAAIGSRCAELVRVAYTGNYVHTLNGISSDHVLHSIDAGLFLPLVDRIGIGAAYQWFSRDTGFDGATLPDSEGEIVPDVHTSVSETRIYVRVNFD